jgi:histidine triad (HIT) family protein
VNQEDCLFCRIIRKEIPARIHYEDEQTLAFYDIAPVAPTHVLIVPKAHIASLDAARLEQADLLGHIQLVAAQIAAGIPDLASGYRLITNCGEWGGQTVMHLHYHLIGGKPLAWIF